MAIEPPTMTEADQAALRLAVEMTLADPDHGGVEQVTKFINGYDNEKLRPMLAVNKFCSYYHRPKIWIWRRGIPAMLDCFSRGGERDPAEW
jgi:hypothetical protein